MSGARPLRRGGPAVVALGGGHGLSATLRAVRRYAGEITAVVSVADDGGSSGRLRLAMGGGAPGDVRKCLVALGDPASLWSDAFEYRFPAGDLAGHSLGNLILAGLTAVTGDFTVAVAEAGRLLGAEGRVLPATTKPVSLRATTAHGEVDGQVAVMHAGRLSSVSIVPSDAEAPEEAVEAIMAADQVIIGPGSLFTSVLAVAVVPGLRHALQETRARRVYVCNLRPQTPETEGFDVAAHVAALAAHGVEVDVVVADTTWMDRGDVEVGYVEAQVGRADGAVHDPSKLAAVLADLFG